MSSEPLPAQTCVASTPWSRASASRRAELVGLVPAATLASLIVNNFGEATGTELAALFGAALVLLVIGISVNALARVLVKSTVRGGAASVAVA